MVDVQQHFFEFCRRQLGCGWLLLRRRFLGRRRGRLFLFDVNGARVRELLYFRAAAGRAGDQLFLQLFLKIFETWKPAFKGVFFLAEKIVDDHGALATMNKGRNWACQGLVEW